MVKKRTSNQKEDLGFFLVLGAILILLNLASGYFFLRFDLTEEHRFSLSNSSIQVLENLESPVYVELFLEGELPKDFKRLQQAIKETLDEFRVYAGPNIQYEFRNPTESGDPRLSREVFQHLIDRGLNPTTLYLNEGDQRVEKLIFPGAVISYQTSETPVMFLAGDPSKPPIVQINQSIENLEFSLISALRRLTTKRKKSVAFLQGHGELNPLEAADFIHTISESYEVKRVRLQGAANGNFDGIINLDAFDAIICAGPDTAFSDQDKFKLDQYIVKGGKALFLVEGMAADIDSIGPQGAISISMDHRLGDLFFNLGFRVNPDLVQDQFSAAIPLVVGYMGDRPQYQLMKWPYFPILNEFADHPISRNSQPVYGKFISTMDTVKREEIRKTVLVTTSPFTRVLLSPVKLDFNEVRQPPKKELFNKGKQIAGLLLEGNFRSMFQGRVTPQLVESLGFEPVGKPGKVIVFSDADLMKNDINSKDQTPYPLGYDKFSKATFGNKALLINALDYLLDESGIMEARNKKVILRPLDPEKVKAQRSNLLILNLGLPIALLSLAALIIVTLRKRRFERSTL